MEAAQLYALEYLNFGRGMVDFHDRAAIAFIGQRQKDVAEYIEPAKRILGQEVFQPQRFVAVRQNIIDAAIQNGLTISDGEAYLEMVHTISVNYQQRQREQS
jgi:hypothetical protein